MQDFLTSEGATDVGRVDKGGVTDVTGTVSGRGPVRFEIRAEGTETGFTALKDGTAEMAMASRKITDQEVRDLAARGTLDGRDSEVVLAVDAVAVIVPKERTLPALTLDQLRAIFTCTGTPAWSAIDGATGPSGPIHVIAMDDNSGTFETFRDVVLDGQDLCKTAKRDSDHRRLSDAVKADPLAIGFVSLPYAAPNNTVALSDDGTASLPPNADTVSLESYLMTRRLYLYLPTRPIDDPLLRKFATSYAVSETAQATVVRNGFVSAYPPPQTATPQPCTAGVPDYCTAIAGAERVPFDVRFDTGTFDVDNRAFRNLDLLVEQLKRPDNAGKQVVLLGFTDNVGSDDKNRELARQRAESVKAYLAGKGVTAEPAKGLGAAPPIATNDTPEGREQNRRVECG